MCFFEKKKQKQKNKTMKISCFEITSVFFFFGGKNSEPNGPTFEEKILKKIENLIAIDMRSRYEVINSARGRHREEMKGGVEFERLIKIQSHFQPVRIPSVCAS